MWRFSLSHSSWLTCVVSPASLTSVPFFPFVYAFPDTVAPPPLLREVVLSELAYSRSPFLAVGTR